MPNLGNSDYCTFEQSGRLMALPPGVLAAQARAQRAQKRQDFLQNFINEAGP